MVISDDEAAERAVVAQELIASAMDRGCDMAVADFHRRLTQRAAYELPLIEPRRIEFFVDATKDASHEMAQRSRCMRRAARQYRQETGLIDEQVVCVVLAAERIQALLPWKRDQLRFAFLFGPNLFALGDALGAAIFKAKVEGRLSAGAAESDAREIRAPEKEARQEPEGTFAHEAVTE